MLPFRTENIKDKITSDFDSKGCEFKCNNTTYEICMLAFSKFVNIVRKMMSPTV